MQACSHTQIAESHSTGDTLPPVALTPLTGRDQEVALLDRLWAQVKNGAGRVVLISGEPGLGKSRLVHTLMERSQAAASDSSANPLSGVTVVKSRPPPIVEWRCSATFQNTGLYPAIEFFERFLDFHSDMDPSHRFERLVEHLAGFELARPDVVPFFATLLSLPLDNRFPSLGLPPARERQEIFRALRRWFRLFSVRNPVLFVVEDLHWADTTTLEFLDQFICSSHGDKFLTVLTFRPEFQPSWPNVVDQTKLPLHHLTMPEVDDLVRRKIDVSALPKALVEIIFDRAEGVPLFVEEVVQGFKDAGLLDHAKKVRPEALERLIHKVPPNLRKSITSRLDRMPNEKELAQIASTLGREFSYEMLAAVSGLDPVALQAQLDRLVQAEILRSRGHASRASYFFKHALVEDAIYSSLAPGRRSVIHARVAQALRAGFPGIIEQQPELMAHHLTVAGRASDAVEFWRRAGLNAQRRGAEKDAIIHFKKGLHLLRSLPPSPERDRQELQFLTPLATSIQLSRGYSCDEALGIFERARELCHKSDDFSPLFAIIWGLWAWHLVRGNHLSGFDRAVEALALARHQDDPGMVMETLLMVGVSQFYLGDFLSARGAIQRAISDYDNRERTRQWSFKTGHDAGLTTRGYLAQTLWYLGYPDQALALDREMISLAQQFGDPFSLTYAYYQSSCLLFQCQMGTELEAATASQLQVSNGLEFHWYHAMQGIFTAGAMILGGRPEEAIPLLRKGIAQARDMGSERNLPQYFGMLGDACIRAGHLSEARDALSEASALIEKNRERTVEAEIQRLHGELLVAQSDANASLAEEQFRAAIATARSQNARSWELRATLSLAQLLKRQRRADEALFELRAIFEQFDEGFSTPDLISAAALLEEIARASNLNQTPSPDQAPKVGA